MAPNLLKALKQIHEEYGVEHVTVANLTLARLIRKAIPQLKIAASTLMGISTPLQVVMAQDCLDTLIPETRALRDLRLLRRLRKVSEMRRPSMSLPARLPAPGAAFAARWLTAPITAVAVPSVLTDHRLR
jgi:hypothetical protein